MNSELQELGRQLNFSNVRVLAIFKLALFCKAKMIVGGVGPFCLLSHQFLDVVNVALGSVTCGIFDVLGRRNARSCS